MRTFERAIIGLEYLPWSIFYRAAVGYWIVPLYSLWADQTQALWKMWVIFVAMLAALRIAPAVARRVLPFSAETKAIWAQRREWAKRFDSYQWQKLLGIGLGWLAGILSSENAPQGTAALAIACTFAGAAGLVIWRWRSRSIAQPLTATV